MIKNLEFVNSSDTGTNPSSGVTEVFVDANGVLSQNDSNGVVTTIPTASATATLSNKTLASPVTSGVTTVAATGGIVSSLATTNQRIVPFFGAGAQATPAPAAAIPLTNYFSTLDSTAGATTQTLAEESIAIQAEEPRNMQIMVKGTKEIRCIKKSEYDYLNHIAL